MYFHFWCIILLLAGSLSAAISESCIVPAVNNGEVGNYVHRRYIRRRHMECFFQLEVGESIDDADSVILRCEKGYLPAGNAQTHNIRRSNEEEILCKGGTWSKAIQCKAEITCEEPPSIDFATFTNLVPGDYPLGNIVVYECQPGYVIKGRTTTSRCVMSKNGLQAVWTRPSMSCVDEVLQPADENLSGSSTTTIPTQTLPTRKNLIFLPRRNTPIASTSYSSLSTTNTPATTSSSTTASGDCSIKPISNGAIRERKFGETIWNWSTFRYERPITMEKVPLGTVPSLTAVLFLTCNKGYFFQGIAGLTERQINCSRGKWVPDAVCLREGTRLVRTTAAPKQTTQKSKVNEPTQATPVTVSITTARFVVPKPVPSSTPSTTKVLTEATSLVPHCSMDSLFAAVPNGVVINMDDVNKDIMPHNTTFRLNCENENMVLEGSALAKCETDGKWNIGSLRCVYGCLPLTVPPDSSLIVTPEKEKYRFGEIITLSCPPEMDLNMEVELIMCLRGGWSETQQPECIEA